MSDLFTVDIKIDSMDIELRCKECDAVVNGWYGLKLTNANTPQLAEQVSTARSMHESIYPGHHVEAIIPIVEAHIAGEPHTLTAHNDGVSRVDSQQQPPNDQE